MKLLIFCVLCYFPPFKSKILTFAFNSTIQNTFDESKIISGRPPIQGNFESLVGIIETDTNLRYCSGSVLSMAYILTACHCSVNLRFDRIFPLNTTVDPRMVSEVPFSKDSQTRDIRHFFLHSECARGHWIWLNDVAIALLDKPFKKFGGILPIRVWSHDYMRSALKYEHFFVKNRTCNIAGTGLRAMQEGNFGSKKSAPPILSEVEQFVTNIGTCFDVVCQNDWKEVCDLYHWRDLSLDGILCAFRRDEKLGGPCWGDSGAPLLCDEDEPSFDEAIFVKPRRGYAVAILSATFYCGTKFGGPSFYMQLRKYWGFISVFLSRFKGAPAFHEQNKANCEGVEYELKKCGNIKGKSRAARFVLEDPLFLSYCFLHFSRLFCLNI